MDDKEIIQVQDRIITELTGVIKCMADDPPCVKMIQDAMEIKAKIDGAKKCSNATTQ